MLIIKYADLFILSVFFLQNVVTVSGVASPCLMELSGAAGGAVRSSSPELSGVVGDTAVVLSGLVSGRELLVVEDHVVTLVIISGSGKVPVITNTLQSEGSNQGTCSIKQVKSLLKDT